ncbi:hypothetical protein LX81_02595 [Palleronia aestuarii]|uniref:Uncharacterized protein n=1 Tax=Palleronia aestuarii TaxID=568105 RepID=A0A2W7NVN7_9RHOB|nr:hypothetical protein [Palleronia aestuarii]PZX15292.1 hypothetical protein LX81_02595 [Palleronia aestuarii]
MLDLPRQQQDKAVRRVSANIQAIAMGFDDGDLAMLYRTLVRILEEVWSAAPDIDESFGDLDRAQIRRDIAAFRGGAPLPGLKAGFVGLARLIPILGPRDLVRIGTLLELHADYTILSPAILSHEAWVARLRRAGRTIQSSARRLAEDPLADRTDLEAELAFLANVLLKLSS